MRHIEIESLFVIDKFTGLPQIMHAFLPVRNKMDPDLFSSFLSAVTVFSNELTESPSSYLQITYGSRTISIVAGNRCLFAVVHQLQDIDNLIPLLYELLEEFEASFAHNLDAFGVPYEEYEKFKERIIERIGIHVLKQHWIPIIVERDDSEVPEQLQDMLGTFDGIRSISELLTGSEMTEAQLLAAISRLWAANVLSFRNVIEPTEILVPTRTITRFLHPYTDEHHALAAQFGESVRVLPRVVRALDGRARVCDLLDLFEGETEGSCYSMLHSLYENQALDVMSPENKRLVLAKEVLQKALDVASEVYGLEPALHIVNSLLARGDWPTVEYEVGVNKADLAIDYKSWPTEGLNPAEVMELYEIWIDFVKSLLRSLLSLGGHVSWHRMINRLAEEMTERILDAYGPEDLAGLESFTSWLELLLVEPALENNR